ncbi:MAG: DnaA/Hda family protein [Fibromonadales bacterium]|nr:DnaA/Hda family protein [Fibromonadales bacterium]
MNTDNKTAVDSFVDGIVRLNKSVSDSTLDSDFLFKGGYKCLKKAVAHAKETVDKVVNKQPLPINPLIFVGEIDSCKNHLLHAMWNSLLKEKQKIGEGEPIVLYSRITHFHDSMVALYESFNDEERKALFLKILERVKGVDMVFIDEIQYLEGKIALNLVLEVIKFMESINKQMVITSQKIGIDKTGIVPDLAERLDDFEYIKILPPDAEDRLKMLENFIKEENLSLENQQLMDDWVKNTEKHSLRFLMDKLNRLVCEAEGRVITAKTMEQIFEEKDSVKKILDFVSEHFKIDIKTLVNEERKFAYERSIAMYFIKSANKCMDFDEVGKKLGRSENTARMACDGIERALNGGEERFNKIRPVQIIADVEEISRLLQT